LATCLAGLQPVALASQLPSISALDLFATLKQALPEEQLQWGMQHDTAEVLQALFDVMQRELTAWCSVHGRRRLPDAQCGLKALSARGAGGASGAASPHGSPQAQLRLLEARPPPGSSPAAAASLAQAAAVCRDGGWQAGGCQRSLQLQQLQTPPTQGCLLHSMTCLACGNCFASSLTPFTVLPLPLPPAADGDGGLSVRPGVRLAECLARFAGSEVVEGVNCPRCSLAAALGCPPGAAAAAAAPAGPAAAWGGATGPASCAPGGGAGAQLAAWAAASREAGAGAAPRAAGSLLADAYLPRGLQPCYAPAGPPAPAPRAAAGRLRRRHDLLALATSSAPLPDLDYPAEVGAAGLDWADHQQRVVRQVLLGRAPRVLLLQLQRSLHTALGVCKLHGWVSFPLVLDAAPIMAHVPAGCGACCCCRRSGSGGAAQAAAASSSGGSATDSGSGRADGGAASSASSSGGGCGGAGAAASDASGGGRAAARGGSGMQQEPCATQRLRYGLVAVVQHLGSASSGHYVMYRRMPAAGHAGGAWGGGGWPGARQVGRLPTGEGGEQLQGSWVMVSDERVRGAPVSEVLACEAALLVYEQLACSCRRAAGA
jgi:hypothetical protein